MKIVVQILPDEAEQVLYDLNIDDFTVDEDIYYYFRDEVFIKEMEKYIQNKIPGKLKDTKNCSDAENVNRMYDNQELIIHYYPEYNKIRDKFYLYKGKIYSYEFLGFQNVGNEIQLVKHDMQDLLKLLNYRPKSTFKMLINKLFKR